MDNIGEDRNVYIIFTQFRYITNATPWNCFKIGTDTTKVRSNSALVPDRVTGAAKNANR